MTAVDVVVRGRVQGVGFRFQLVEEAEELGVTGWVRNEPDGSVGGHFEGAADAVDRLVEWCRQGPRYAKVEAVDVTEVEETGAASFAVRW